MVLYYAQLFIGVTSLFSPEVSEEDVKTDDEDDEEEEDDIKSFPRSKSDWEAFRCILIFKNRFFEIFNTTLFCLCAFEGGRTYPRRLRKGRRSEFASERCGCASEGSADGPRRKRRPGPL